MTQHLPHHETLNESLIPQSWDAKLVLGFLHTPAFETFDAWIDQSLELLESKYPHVRSVSARNTWKRRSASEDVKLAD